MKNYFVILCGLAIGLWNAQLAMAESARVSNDFDGDGKTDPAIYCPGTGQWLVFLIGSQTVTNVITSGGKNSLPAPGDFDGDGKTDFVVFDSTTGNWCGQLSTGGEGEANFGQPGSWPVPADYDGDRVTDLGVYDPMTGIWSLYSLSKGWWASLQWGFLGDFRPWENPKTYTVLPMPFDYNQDGMDDFAYYYRGTNMPSSGGSIYYVRTGTSENYTWGSSGSLPAPGNYQIWPDDSEFPQGLCAYKLTTAEWGIPYRSAFYMGTYGQTLPVSAGDYDGNGYDDNATYNYVTGEWTIIYNTGTVAVDGREKVSGFFGGPAAVPANIYSTIYALARYSPKPW